MWRLTEVHDSQFPCAVAHGYKRRSATRLSVTRPKKTLQIFCFILI